MSFKLFLNNLSKITSSEARFFVLGNSSADYDSIFGSLLYAYLLTNSLGRLHVPLIDCRKSQLKLRFEVMWVLEKVGIESSSLRFFQEIQPLQKEHSFYLYDHNFREQVSDVVGIVDHHDRTRELQTDNALIVHMGSALTIIYYLLYPDKMALAAENIGRNTQFYQAYTKFAKQSPKVSHEKSVDEIIRYGILLDCSGFSETERARWTSYDKLAVDYIEAQGYYTFGWKELSDLKFDRKLNLGLSLQEHLRKDYKRIEYAGIVVEYSVILLGQADFLSTYKLTALQAYCSNCDVYLLMLVQKKSDDMIERHVLLKTNIHTASPMLAYNIDLFLTQIQLEKVSQLDKWGLWRDPSSTMSRKKIDKLFRSFMQIK